MRVHCIFENKHDKPVRKEVADISELEDHSHGVFEEPDFEVLAKMEWTLLDEFQRLAWSLCVVACIRQWWMSTTKSSRTLRRRGCLATEKRLSEFPKTFQQFQRWIQCMPQNEFFSVVSGRDGGRRQRFIRTAGETFASLTKINFSKEFFFSQLSF